MSPVLPLLLRRRASRKDYIMRTDNLDGHAAATAAARHFLYKTIPPRARDVPSISAPAGSWLCYHSPTWPEWYYVVPVHKGPSK
mmetsp:Transcript_11498/g.25780  ORF Transcript_11498/g.25780 Transcript_11498/m.25780 type:complete len:84 (+) Transcript_11498:300-551(+)